MSIASTRIAAPGSVGRSSTANALPASLTITGAGEIPDSHRWDSSPKIRFAPDSLLEETGLEPLVPAATEPAVLSENNTAIYGRIADRACGTGLISPGGNRRKRLTAERRFNFFTLHTSAPRHFGRTSDFKQSLLQSLAHGIGAGHGAKLTKQRLDVEFDRVLGNAEPARRGLVIEPIGDCDQHLGFAGRQQ